MADVPNEPVVYLNRDFAPLGEAKISVLDQGFLLGDGVLDVVSAWRGSGCERGERGADQSP